MTVAAENVAVEVEPRVCPTELRPPLHATALRRSGALAFLALTFCIALFLYTRNNDGPSWYHPDEDGKASQVLSGQFRNFKHPLLLLEASELMTRLHHPGVHIPRGLPTIYRDMNAFPGWAAQTHNEAVVQDGRLVSAIFGATAATCLAAAAYLAFGWAGLILAALMLVLCPQLLLYSHDMKEDSALACGVGMTVLAAALFWTRPGPRWRLWTLPLLGIAAAVATSSKYVGFFSLACALPALLLAQPFCWWRTLVVRPVVFTATFLLVLLLINHRALECRDGFRKGLEQETEHALTGHNDVTMNRPNAFALHSAWLQVQLHAWVLSASFLVMMLVLWRRRGAAVVAAGWRQNGWQVIVLLLLATWCVTLSYNTIPFHRYTLPIIILAYFLGALGAAASLHLLRGRWRLVATAVLAGVVLLLQLPVCLAFNRDYGDDSREHLRQWLIDHAPPGATVAGDRYAQVGYPADPRNPGATRSITFRPIYLEQVSKPWYVFGAGSLLDDLRRAGVRYVAISEPSYERYTSPFTKAEPGQESEFRRHRDLYSALLNDYTPIWQSQQEYPNHSFINPPIKLYDLAQKSPPTPTRTRD